MRENFFSFWIKLLKLYFKKHKSYPNGEKDYFIFQKYQADHLFRKILNVFSLNRTDSVCDYGCGKGGYTLVLSNYFDDVVGVDFYRGIYKELEQKVKFKKANLISYRGEPMSFLFCASVIEHIPKNKQADFIFNLKNNIKKGGYLYLSYPPFYSINGGHLAAPFHYLPDKIALWLMRKTREKGVYSYDQMFGEYGLTKTSIEEVEKLLNDAGFKILKIGSRFMPDWYSRLFGRNNFLNWHIEFYCQNE